MLGRNPNQPGQRESSWGRSIGMFLFACTGIGALYMLACTRWIEPGKVGVVSNYLTGEREILEPGIHCILSPFRTFHKELPSESRNVFAKYNDMRVHTADNLETSVKVDIAYQVNDPIKATTNIEGAYQDGVKTAVETALANVIREQNFSYQMLAASRRPQMALPPRKKEKSNEAKSELALQPQPAEQKDIGFSKLSQSLIQVVNDICKVFGVTITRFQIVDMKAVDSRIEHDIEVTSRTQFNAINMLLAAQNEQEAKKIQSETREKVMEIDTRAEAARVATLMKAQTDAQKERLQTIAQCIADPKVAQVMAYDTQIKISENLSQNKGMLALGSTGTPFNMFAQPQLSAGTQILEAKAPALVS